MTPEFKGWGEVAEHLHKLADSADMELNKGQQASLLATADRIHLNGVIIADEVGMGKTRIAAAIAKCVIASGGRVAILAPPGLGFQWRDELQKSAGIETPSILRSLWQFLKAWEDEQSPKSWFEENVLLISHAFANWRLGAKSEPWRWALLPELYACWRQHTNSRLPHGYHKNEKLGDKWVRLAGKSIVTAVSVSPDDHPCRGLMKDLAEKTPWPGSLEPAEYERGAQLRPLLERAVGLGLGAFDLVITDEAHKSRGESSGLSRLLEQIVIPAGDVRRIAMTATPVELDAQQWIQMLKRIGEQDKDGEKARAISAYSEVVHKVRQCPSDEATRAAYKSAAVDFKKTLSPYLLRRDKRESESVLYFQTHTGEGFHAYRQEREILVKTADLSDTWKQAVCAAEALSFVTKQTNNAIAKRLRLTLGNGHGVAALIDEFHRHEVDDKKQDEDDGVSPFKIENGVESSMHDKRAQRAQWWQQVIIRASQDNASGDAALYDHPAIVAAVAAIEDVCQRGEKVLVFGRFTRPLRALVDLLNARAMLRSLEAQQSWSQSKVYENQENAVVAAHRQLQWPAASINRSDLIRDLNRSDLIRDLNQRLDKQYKRLEEQRHTTRETLIEQIETGLGQVEPVSNRVKALFTSFKVAGHKPLAVVARAIHELLGPSAESPSAKDFACAFVDLVEAASDRDESDASGEETLVASKAADLWRELEARLSDEYSRTEGGFARLMYGDTKPEIRRLLQLAFNRPHGHPKVLVAQSLVGREGLNLHKACRTVILLHPEWNPGVVEQQIGRVDRIGSLWEKKLEDEKKRQVESNKSTVPSTDSPRLNFPRIEIYSIVFQGTYDELNWKVLRERWADLRAQLHGVVISPLIAEKYIDHAKMIAEINDSAPNFSPPSKKR